MPASVTAGRGGRAIAIAALVMALAACGLKDDLYLPDPPEAAGQTPGETTGNDEDENENHGKTP